MTIIDANDLEPGADIAADVCVVGSGAAGMTVATELDRTPQNICLLESGGYGPDEQTQALYEIDVVGHAVRENFMSRARYFGGTSNLWAGRSMRLAPFDFRVRDWVPHSGWPISYDELSRYYPAAEHILRLPSVDATDAVVDVSRKHPIERHLVENGELRSNVAVWGRKALRFGDVYRRQLQRSRNISVCLNANVTGIDLNEAGDHVSSLTGRTMGGTTFHIKARNYVLACGGLETARLLLASRSVQREGVGNLHDVVGRYYMDHPRAVFGRVRLSRPLKLSPLLGVPLADGQAQVGIQFREETQEREHLLNNYLTLERFWSDVTAEAYQSFVHSAKILLRTGYAGSRFRFSQANLARVPELIYLLAPRELLPHPVYRAGRQLKEWFSRGVTDLVVVNYCEQAPNPQSRVSLGHNHDRFGMPRLVLNWIVGQRETDSLLRLHELLDSHLRRHGLGGLDHASTPFGELKYTDASHHLGTTRMSANPREGVVNEDARVHGVSNLFIAGSGIFPTAGHANPTLTIVALAIRLANHLKTLAGRDR